MILNRFALMSSLLVAVIAGVSPSRPVSAATPDVTSIWQGCGGIGAFTDLGAAEGRCEAYDAVWVPHNYPGTTYVPCGWQLATYDHAFEHYTMLPQDKTACTHTDNLNQSCPAGLFTSAYPGWCLMRFGTLTCTAPSVLDSSKQECVSPTDLNNGTPLNCHCYGDPINPAAGNTIEEATDYQGSGPFPLVFKRTYNSNIANANGSSPFQATKNENMGYGWSTNIGAHLYISQYSPAIVSGGPCIVNSLQYFCPPMYALGATTYNMEVTAWHADGGQERFTLVVPIGSFEPVGSVYASEAGSKGALSYINLPSPLSGTGYKYLRPDGYTEYYDSDGNLQAVQDRHGLMQTYHIDYTGRLGSITDPAGRSLTFIYDTNKRISTVTNPAGGVYTYAYDANGNLASVTYPDNSKVLYQYTNSTYKHALTGLVDENNHTYGSWGYDATGRANTTQSGGGIADPYSFVYNADGSTDITEPTGQVLHMTFNTVNYVKVLSTNSAPCTKCGDTMQSVNYDSNGYVSNTTDFNGNVTHYVHDATGLETSRTEAYGTAQARTITTTWDTSLRQPTLITEPGRTTAYTYDTAGNVLTKTVTDTATSVARTTTYTYNTQGLLATVDGPRTDVSDVTTYGYTTAGDLNSITDALGHQTQITSYDANGLPLTIVDPNGITTTLTYDGRQRLLTKTVNGAETTTFTYDLAGNLTKVTLPDSSYLQYGYDNAHRLTSVTDNFGNKIVYTLDNLGNRTTEQTKDTGGTVQRTLSRVYDNLNHLHQLIGGMSQTTTYTNDNLGNPTTITDPMTNATGQAFDALNRLMSVTDPQSGVTTYNQDALDHVTDVTDPRGLNTHYDYDAFGDVTELDSPDTGTTTYTYDLAGNRLTKLDANGVTATYVYDAFNRLTSISYPTTSKNVTYTYDAGTYGKGHLTGIADASGTTAYTYDAYGNVTQKVVVEGGQSFTVGYSYDLANNLLGITYPDGMAVAYTRDAAGRITSVTENGNNVVSSVGYKPFGPITGLTYGSGLVETRTYDQDYRLTGISIPSTQGLTFGYNANDDITGITDSISAANTQTLGYDSLNRLTSATSGTGGYGSQSYTYDADGNRTLTTLNSVNTTYAPDVGDNRLASLSGGSTVTYSYDSNGNTIADATHTYQFDDTNRLTTVDSGTTATYTYNALGQRTSKTTGLGTSLFIYDEVGYMLGEYTSSGSLVQEHIWLRGRPIGVVNSAGLYYVHSDQLTTPRRITDASHAVVWNWTSDPFGNIGPTGSFTYNQRYVGQYADSETNHTYNYYRDYDSATNRYLESDPIGLLGGVNTYSYVRNNPITRIDPFGLADSPTDTIISAVARGDTQAIQDLIDAEGLNPQQEMLARQGLETIRLMKQTTDNLGQLARLLKRSQDEVRKAVEICKQKGLPKGSEIRNPDVRIDFTNGEVYPEGPNGILGDSIGNIFDYLH